MPDIRDVLKGLSPDDRAAYAEIRTIMRRAYLGAHARVLPIERYELTDDAFLDLIDIKIAMLFDRAGVFDHSEGNIETDKAAQVQHEVQESFESAATRMMRQNPNNGNNGADAKPWPKGN